MGYQRPSQSRILLGFFGRDLAPILCLAHPAAFPSWQELYHEWRRRNGLGSHNQALDKT